MSYAILCDLAVSYAGEDRKQTEALVRALARRGANAFYDQELRSRLFGTNLNKLKEVYRDRARYCLVLYSSHYKDKEWPMTELGAALDRASQQEDEYLLVVRLDDSPLVEQLRYIGYMEWTREGPETLADLIAEKLGKVPYWQPVAIEGRGDEGPAGWSHSWRDIFWMGKRGWLCGAIEEGGGGPVGRGILLYTSDAGVSWQQVNPGAFEAGEGTFTWGPHGTRLYSWNDVGPINTIRFYNRMTGRGEFQLQGWLAASTGVYSSYDEGATWQRSTPPPHSPERYALFNNLADIEGFTEVYASGWQGIAHCVTRNGEWRLQVPSYVYSVRTVSAYGGSENRNVWALGWEWDGMDDRGNASDKGHGSIYHLEGLSDEWRRMPLPDVELMEGQALNDILQVDLVTVFVAGDQGLVLKGARKPDGSWRWIPINTGTDHALYSLAFSEGSLWFVGAEGVVLRSPDRGETWIMSELKLEDGSRPALTRIRFFGEGGWITGGSVVLKSVRSHT